MNLHSYQAELEDSIKKGEDMTWSRQQRGYQPGVISEGIHKKGGMNHCPSTSPPGPPKFQKIDNANIIGDQLTTSQQTSQQNSNSSVAVVTDDWATKV